MSTTISLGFDTTSESSNIEDDSDVDAFDSHIFSSQSAYTHTFTSPAPEQCKNQPKKLPAAADEMDITRTKTPSLPIEVIDYIVSFLFDSCLAGCFFHIHSFSLVCSQFRHLALRHYFSSIRVASAKQLAGYMNIHFSLTAQNTSRDSVGFDCVKCVYSHMCPNTLTRMDKLDRTLIAPSHALDRALWNPYLYRNLKHLMISFSSDGRQSQTTRLQRLFSPMPLTPCLPSHLTSLTLTKLWRIDVPLLKTVASAFPAVKV